jgi:6-phosphogluconolactonase
VYIGTYTDGASKGIYRSELDLANGRLSAPVLAAQAANPSFLAIHPNCRFLYGVSEVGDFGGQKSGALLAFAVEAKYGDLTPLNRQATGGGAPCHLTVDRRGKHVLTVNYGGGSVCVLPLSEDGRLGKPTAFIQHEGKSVDPGRQEAPHAHSVDLDAANRFALVADLGLDKVLIYRFDSEKGTLTANDPASVTLAAGAGPRHLAVHPGGRNVYVINELNSTVIALALDPDRGRLSEFQTLSALPAGFTGRSWAAEIQVHPTGRFLYCSNRGHDSIAVFGIDPQTGKLTAAGHQAEGIKTPRHFAIDPTGTYLIVANQGADNLVVYRIDPRTGALTATGSRVDVPRPVCVLMTSPGL